MGLLIGARLEGSTVAPIEGSILPRAGIVTEGGKRPAGACHCVSFPCHWVAVGGSEWTPVVPIGHPLGKRGGKWAPSGNVPGVVWALQNVSFCVGFCSRFCFGHVQWVKARGVSVEGALATREMATGEAHVCSNSRFLRDRSQGLQTVVPRRRVCDFPFLLI